MTDELLQRIMKNSDTISHVLNDEVITKLIANLLHTGTQIQ